MNILKVGDYMFSVTALGEALIDFTFSGYSKDNQRLFEQNAGGAPLNMLAAVSSCGLKTAFIGKVGNDMHGQFLIDTMEKANIDTSSVILADDYFTTLAFVNIDSEGQRYFSFARKNSADVMLKEDEINLEVLKNSKVFHLGSLSLTQNPAKDATFFALNKAKEASLIISYDPNYRASLWQNEEKAKEEMRSLIPFVDIIKISDEECELLTDETDYELAAKVLNEKGVKIVCVTLGENGVYVFANGKGVVIKGFKAKEVVDTTGAGDSFFGGFIYKLLEEEINLNDIDFEILKKAGLFGNAVASLCVEKRGGIPSIPTKEAILKRLNEAYE